MKRAILNSLAALVAVVALVMSPAALAAKKKSPTPAPAADSNADKVEKVNLNTASEKDIAAAKGVSDKLAKELVKNRPYKTWAEVSNVKGVGTGKKLDALKKVLKLSGGEAASDEMSAKEKKAAKSEKAEKAEKAAAKAEKAEKTPAAASKSSKSAASDEAEKSSTPKLARGEVININRASAAELEKLPEIGPVKSQAIVDYRNANGKFNSIEDIMKVSGIKEGTFAKIKDSIVVR